MLCESTVALSVVHVGRLEDQLGVEGFVSAWSAAQSYSSNLSEECSLTLGGLLHYGFRKKPNLDKPVNPNPKFESALSLSI